MEDGGAILLDGEPTRVTREGDELVAADGRRMPLDDPIHLPPVEPTKIVCVHLNYESRRAEFQATLGPAPDLLPQADLVAERARGRDRTPAAVPLPELRGRDRHRDR